MSDNSKYFVAPSEEDRDRLRQGDIIKDVPFFGGLDLAKGMMTISRGAVSQKQEYSFSTADVVNCIVVSACCEMDRANEGKSHTVLLAPWRELKRGGKPETLVKLQSPDLDNITAETSFRFIWTPQFIDNGLVEGLFDLSALFSISKGSQDYLRSKRVLSASEKYREYIKKKIAIFFARTE